MHSCLRFVPFVAWDPKTFCATTQRKTLLKRKRKNSSNIIFTIICSCWLWNYQWKAHTKTWPIISIFLKWKLWTSLRKVIQPFSSGSTWMWLRVERIPKFYWWYPFYSDNSRFLDRTSLSRSLLNFSPSDSRHRMMVSVKKGFHRRFGSHWSGPVFKYFGCQLFRCRLDGPHPGRITTL